MRKSKAAVLCLLLLAITGYGPRAATGTTPADEAAADWPMYNHDAAGWRFNPAEQTLGPVFSGPALSRGRVYVGGGNTLWTPSPFECFFPKQDTGSVRCFGLHE